MRGATPCRWRRLRRVLDGTRSPRSRWLPLAAMTAVMGLLVATTLVVEARTTSLRHELNDVLLPAGPLVQSIPLYISRGMGQLRAYAITGHPRFRERHAASRAAEERAWARLLPASDALGPRLRARILALRDSALHWHALVEAASPAIDPAEPTEGALLLETMLYETLLSDFDALSAALDGEVRRHVAELERMEVVQTSMTLVLALLAIVAAAGATWLVGRTQELAREAEERREALERLSEGRARLVRGLTHDVKNPLAAATGYTHLLELKAADRLDAEQRAWLVSIRETVDRATAMLDDLLELSLAEAGQLRLRPERVAVQDAVVGAAADEAVHFEAAGIAFEVIAPGMLPVVEADPRRLREILANLLTNARKYTPAGGRVTLRAGVRSDPAAPAPGSWLCVDVADTGRGIPSEHHEAIFDEFTRLDAGAAPGMGIGLAISRRLAQLMGGHITVESRPGAGSTFTLWLPLAGARSRRGAA